MANAGSILLFLALWNQVQAEWVNLPRAYLKELTPRNFLGIALLVFPPLLFMGMLFPYAISQLDKHSARGQIPKLLAINTLGAVLGSLLTTYGLFASIGVLNSIRLLLAGCLVAFFTLDLGPSKYLRARVLLPFFATVVALSFLVKPTLQLASAPLFSSEDAHGYTTVIHTGPTTREMLHQHTTVVAPYEDPGTDFVQNSVSIYPLLLSKRPNTVLVIGMGYGLSSSVFFKATLEKPLSVETVELIPGIIAAQSLFDKNEKYFSHPNHTAVQDDGRSYLAKISKKYDIISINVTPFTPGSTAVHSREFYQLVKHRLAKDGVFSQLFFGPPETLASQVLTIKSEFPHVVFMPAYFGDGLIAIASLDLPLKHTWPSDLTLAQWQRVSPLYPLYFGRQEIQNLGDYHFLQQQAQGILESLPMEHGEIVSDSKMQIELYRTGWLDVFKRYPANYF